MEEVSGPDVAVHLGPADECASCLGPEALVRPGGENKCLVPGNMAGPTHCSRDFTGPSNSKAGLETGCPFLVNPHQFVHAKPPELLGVPSLAGLDPGRSLWPSEHGWHRKRGFRVSSLRAGSGDTGMLACLWGTP